MSADREPLAASLPLPDKEQWETWRNELTSEQINEVLRATGPPYVEGTCYPLARYVLIYGVGGAF